MSDLSVIADTMTYRSVIFVHQMNGSADPEMLKEAIRYFRENGGSLVGVCCFHEWSHLLRDMGIPPGKAPIEFSGC